MKMSFWLGWLYSEDSTNCIVLGKLSAYSRSIFYSRKLWSSSRHIKTTPSVDWLWSEPKEIPPRSRISLRDILKQPTLQRGEGNSMLMSSHCDIPFSGLLGSVKRVRSILFNGTWFSSWPPKAYRYLPSSVSQIECALLLYFMDIPSIQESASTL